MKLQALKRKLSSGKSLLVFTHDHPDPDCMASACILEAIAGHFGLKTRSVYGGDIKRPENQAMLRQLDINLFRYRTNEEGDYDLVALVDTQKPMGNHSLPASLVPDLTFDHHEIMAVGEGAFFDIEPTWGATASILLQYYKQLGLEPNEQIATAYCYALSSETRDLGPDATDLEIQLYKWAVKWSNMQAISRMRYARKPSSFLGVLCRAVEGHSIDPRTKTFHCNLGEVDRPECLAEVADLVVGIEGLHFVLVVANYQGRGWASARTQLKGHHLGRLMQRVFARHNESAGGHEFIGAGQFAVGPESIVSDFLDEVASSLQRAKNLAQELPKPLPQG